jgi:hypothetical protein
VRDYIEINPGPLRRRGGQDLHCDDGWASCSLRAGVWAKTVDILVVNLVVNTVERADEYF